MKYILGGCCLLSLASLSASIVLSRQAPLAAVPPVVPAANGSNVSTNDANGSAAPAANGIAPAVGNGSAPAAGNGSAAPAAGAAAPAACGVTDHVFTQPKGGDVILATVATVVSWTPFCNGKFVRLQMCAYKSGGNVLCYDHSMGYLDGPLYFADTGQAVVTIVTYPAVPNSWYAFRLFDDTDNSTFVTSPYWNLAQKVAAAATVPATTAAPAATTVAAAVTTVAPVATTAAVTYCYLALAASAVTEGEDVGTPLSYAGQADTGTCSAACDATAGCNSYAACSDGTMCYFKTGVQTAAVPTQETGCQTYYKTSVGCPAVR